ncbi:hypothetical protein Golomagni_02800 [Golovinomyces magnicellulatus]|nr:hypothetical protein Golomagni_02800 [Golovinomyces magnicellulatus]
MESIIESTITWCEKITTKYENYKIQNEEIWEIASDNLNEAIGDGILDPHFIKPTRACKNGLMDLRGVLRRKGVSPSAFLSL